MRKGTFLVFFTVATLGATTLPSSAVFFQCKIGSKVGVVEADTSWRALVLTYLHLHDEMGYPAGERTLNAISCRRHRVSGSADVQYPPDQRPRTTQPISEISPAYKVD